jgi:Mn-containing catalase
MAPERHEEFAPGLDPELQELAGAFNLFKEIILKPKSRPARNGRSKMN